MPRADMGEVEEAAVLAAELMSGGIAARSIDIINAEQPWLMSQLTNLGKWRA